MLPGPFRHAAGAASAVTTIEEVTVSPTLPMMAQRSASLAESPRNDCRCPTIHIEVDGELDHAVVPRLREQMTDALSLRPARLVVDLSRCTFFDVSGINLLLDAHRQLWKQDGRLTLRGAQGRHLNLLALMGLRDVFDLEAPRSAETPAKEMS